jgi:hypothetical protein
MAHSRYTELLLRRERLLMHSAQLRRQLALESQALAAPLALADGAVGAAQWLRRHPLWPAAGLLALLALRPRRTLRWAARLWTLWRGFRRVRRMWLAPERLSAPAAG